MSTSPRTKADKDRPRRRPIYYGVRTIEEYTSLRRQGMTDRQIADQWSMRPRAGASDLTYDLYTAWDAAGSPGRPSEPEEPWTADSPAWVKYRARYQQAWRIWLESLVTGAVSSRHCITCTCVTSLIGE